MIANGLARIGRDVELRYLASGGAVANISLAFTYGRKGEDGKRPTQWVEAALFGKRAEVLAQYLVKGGLVSVTLEDVRIETYQGANGQGHKLVGIVMAIDLVPNGKQEGQQTAPAARPAPRATPKASAGSGFDDMDDQIPFLFNMNTVFDTMGTSKALRRIRNGKGMHMLQACSADC